VAILPVRLLTRTNVMDSRHPRSDAGSQSQESQVTEIVRLPK